MKLIGRVFSKNSKPSVKYKVRRYNGSTSSSQAAGGSGSQKKVRRVSTSSSGHRRSKTKKIHKEDQKWTDTKTT
ncbi:hypothetical protein M8J76_006406 [Diaphorina citri]|nr:hypothetical protein M8J76_006406 [Diaphorina citri]